MAKSYRISKGNEYIIVTVDDSGAYIIKDMAGRKIFLSKYQAKLMKFGISNVMGDSFKEGDGDVKVEEITEREKG
ncbi:MAG TPA: hypothetical protein VND15_03665 [Candidatus Acidoferrales bacterium]|nr:hypothetical protein [Candidatus Acidoferrales bacterium]